MKRSNLPAVADSDLHIRVRELAMQLLMTVRHSVIVDVDAAARAPWFKTRSKLRAALANVAASLLTRPRRLLIALILDLRRGC